MSDAAHKVQMENLGGQGDGEEPDSRRTLGRRLVAFEVVGDPAQWAAFEVVGDPAQWVS